MYSSNREGPFVSDHFRFAFLLLLAGGVMACGADRIIPPPTQVECNGAPATVLRLALFQGTTVSGDALDCVALAGDGASYVIAAQLATATLPYGAYSFRLGAPSATSSIGAEIAAPVSSDPPLQEAMGWDLDAQARAEQWLRGAESRTRIDESRRMRLRQKQLSLSAAAVPETLRDFSVLSSLTSPPAFDSATGRLRFTGQNVLIYVDTLAQLSLSDAEINAFGAVFDEALYAVVRDAFGNPSDIDGNGRIIIVLSPIVNALVSSAECVSSGYVRGFFYAHDLASEASTSNAGEVFYGVVPDPTGRWSCAHTKAEMLAVTPPTFAHEFQHMISYAQHVIERAGASELPWLNEGLSHLAEELGSLHFERKYPPPGGRSVPSQQFPDSSSAFITPNLLYAHRFLFLSTSYSIVSCAPGSFCSLPERAAAWLFLRWLGDQKGDDVFRRLVQTPLAGGANIESAAGETLPVLFGNFVTALWADSLVGVPRNSVAPEHRFHSRNFRVLYRALYEAYGPTGGVGRPFPIEPTALAHDGTVTGTMRPGTFAMYRLTVPRGVPTSLIRFGKVDGQSFDASTGAQLSILRLSEP